MRTEIELTRNATPDAAGPELVLDGVGLELIAIAIDGQELSAGYTVDGDRLVLDDPPDHFRLATTVRIHPESNTSFEGLYRTAAGIYLTQCEAEGFRKITWFPDRPPTCSRATR